MVFVSIIKLFDCKKKIKNPLKNKIKTSNSLLTDISLCLALVTSTILVKTFGTLCVLGVENVIQVDPLPLNSVGCYKSKHLLLILQTLTTSTLFRGRAVGEKSC